MIGKIISIGDTTLKLQILINPEEYSNLMNIHVVFEENDRMIIGEIVNINKDNNSYIASVSLIGQIINDQFQFGIVNKPSFRTHPRFITEKELNMIISVDSKTKETLNLGVSPIYNNYPINIDVNKFFSSHFGIFGNTGSGKSHAVARIFQNLFKERENPAKNATILMFDSFGEYRTAFSQLNLINNGINYKLYTTDVDSPDSKVEIPIWLLDVDDWALLLGATKLQQLTIIDKALKLVKIFKDENEKTKEYKNNTIAKVALDILTSGSHPGMLRDQIFSILTKFNSKNI